MLKTYCKTILIAIFAVALFGCGGEADEAKKLGFASVDEMKEIHAKGWHTKQQYDADKKNLPGQLANNAVENVKASTQIAPPIDANEKSKSNEAIEIMLSERDYNVQETKGYCWFKFAITNNTNINFTLLWLNLTFRDRSGNILHKGGFAAKVAPNATETWKTPFEHCERIASVETEIAPSTMVNDQYLRDNADEGLEKRVYSLPILAASKVADIAMKSLVGTVANVVGAASQSVTTPIVTPIVKTSKVDEGDVSSNMEKRNVAPLSYHPRAKVSNELANDVWKSWNPSGSFGWKKVGIYGKGSYQESIYMNSEKATRSYLGGKVITTLALLQKEKEDSFSVVALVADCEIRVFSRLGGFRSGLKADKSAYYSADEYGDYYFNIGKMVNTNLNELELFLAREAIIKNPFSLISTGTIERETGDVVSAICGPRKEIKSFVKSTLSPPDFSKTNEWVQFKYAPGKNPHWDGRVSYHKDMTRTKVNNRLTLITGWRRIVVSAPANLKELLPSGEYTVMVKVSMDCSHHSSDETHMLSVVLYGGPNGPEGPVLNEAKLGPLFSGRFEHRNHDPLKSELYPSPRTKVEISEQCSVYASIGGK